MAPLWLEVLLRWSDTSSLWQERREGGRREKRRKSKRVCERERPVSVLLQVRGGKEGGREGGREGACMYIDACNSGAAWDMGI